MGFLKSIGFVFFFGLAQASGAAESGVLGFQAWKTARIDEARASLEKAQAERGSPLAGKRVENGKTGESTGGRLQATAKNVRMDAKAQQAQTNLELAQELTVNDYFVLYLSQLKGREAFVEAAKKLAPEESADLMIAYLKHLRSGGAGYDDLPPPSAAGLSAPMTGPKPIAN